MNERDVTRDTENGKDPARLEEDIDRTRASLGRTVDALERRLSPGELVDQALGMARDHGGEFATNLGRSVRNNPMPVILTGVGLAWMMASSNEPRAPVRRSTGYGGYQDWTSESDEWSASDSTGRLKRGVSSAKSAIGSMGENASRAKDSLKHSVSSLADSTSGAVSGTGERMRTQGERMRMQSQRLRSNFETLMEEQPLIAGAIGVAIGAALGAAFPRTEREDRLLGETRDSAVRAAKDKAAEAYEDVKDTAADVVASTRDKAKGSDSQHEPAQPSLSASPTEGSNGTRGQESRQDPGNRPQGSPDI
ncbi:MAG TPA: DUF3618 domain-containing protein [Woeseiaceae bacterium]|nr:DUF3618 domain-containing protein [Woeseiaceae bacterium]